MITQTGFLTPLRVESVDAQTWKLLEDLEWMGTQGDLFIVEAGEFTDFASVPWWTQSLIPKTGTWTKASVVHDKMCDLINEDYRLVKEYGEDHYLFPQIPPVFDSVDADAIFRKNARDEGTGPIRSEMLWLGVRLGALKNPARRIGWMDTFPRFLGDLVAITAVLSGLYLLSRLLF